MKKGIRMPLRQQPVTRMRLRLKQVMLLMTGIAGLIFIVAILYTNIGTVQTAKATTGTETMDSGSFIVNMGIVPQTKGNALKPYGLVYDLIEYYDTQVKWVINPNKVKDGIDFTYKGVDYKGGPFIIPAEYISSTIKTRIAYWQTQGVQGIYTTSSVDVPVYATMTVVPTMTIDNTAGKQGIITNYFTNAGIPASAYSTGPTTALSTCHDLWINPHGDPTWATHSRLYQFAITDGSYVFSQCHATSMMEGAKNTSIPFQQLNFLTTTGLKCYSAGKCGVAITETHGGNSTGPYTTNYPADPMTQFMGTISAALNGGSEDWYIPQSTGGWRPTTKRMVTTSDGVSPGEGVLLAYGPAYGLPGAGWVMYEAGHDFGGTTTDEIAAQRVFFNFMMFAASRKSIDFVSDDIGGTFAENTTTVATVNVSSGTPPYAYKWTSSIAGVSFGSPTSATTAIKIPPSPNKQNGTITVTVTDACSRKNFMNRPITIMPTPLPIVLASFTAKVTNENVVQLNWTTATEKDNDYFTLERSADAKNFSELTKVKGAGTSNIVHNYTYTDSKPLVGTSYYRLKQTDYNGKTEIYKMVTVNTKASNVSNVHIWPNPFIGSFTAEFDATTEGELQAQLFSANGALVYSEKIRVSEGNNTFRYEEKSPLTDGAYILRLMNGNIPVASTKIYCRKN